MQEKASSRGIYYKISDGDIKKPALLFMHGAGSNHTIWAPYLEHFARNGHKVIAIDFRGHGKSSAKNLRSLVLGDFIDDVVDILEKEKIERFIAVGVCFGATIAIELSEMYGKRAEKIVLINLFDKKTINIPRIFCFMIRSAVAFLSLMEMSGAKSKKKRYKDYSRYPSQSNIYYTLSELSSTNLFAYQKSASLLLNYRIDLKKVPKETRVLVIGAEKDLMSSHKKIRNLCLRQNVNNNILYFAIREAGHFITTRKPKMLIDMIEGFSDA